MFDVVVAEPLPGHLYVGIAERRNDVIWRQGHALVHCRPWAAIPTVAANRASGADPIYREGDGAVIRRSMFPCGMPTMSGIGSVASGPAPDQLSGRSGANERRRRTAAAGCSDRHELRRRNPARCRFQRCVGTSAMRWEVLHEAPSAAAKSLPARATRPRAGIASTGIASTN